MAKTSGRVHQMPGEMRMTVQPDLGVVWRTSGVDRRSERVLAQNDKFASKMSGKHLSTGCKGKRRPAFFACLRAAGKAAWGK